MILTDYHVHSNYSSDANASASMETMVEQAVELGLKEIVFTDHHDYLPDGSCYSFVIDFDAYINEFYKVKQKYSSQIDLALGVEIGLMPHLKTQTDIFAAKYPFEFIIASSHDTNKKSHYDHVFFENLDKHTAYLTYFEEVLENIRTYDFFDVYGHLDYIFRYGVYEDNSLNYTDYSDIIDAILKTIILKGKGIEINSSGYRYGLNTFNPQFQILKRYRELGGEIVTIGSDAHSPEFICNKFELAGEYLKSAGFKAYTLFKNKKPIWIELLRRHRQRIRYHRAQLTVLG